MEQIPEQSSVDNEANGLIPPVPKSIAEAEPDIPASTVTVDNGGSDLIPRVATENNSGSSYANTDIDAQQQASENRFSDPDTDSELAKTLDNQHLDNGNRGTEGGGPDAGGSTRYNDSIFNNGPEDASDSVLESNDTVEQGHTNHMDQEAETISHRDNKPSNSQDTRTLIEDSFVENQNHGAEFSATPNGESSLSQLSSSIPSRPEPLVIPLAPPTVEAPNVIPDDASNEETVYILQNNNNPAPSTTPISPTFERLQQANATSHRVWESDKDANECRRCKRRFNFLVRRHHCRQVYFSYRSVVNASDILTRRRCGQVVCDRCSTHRANMARSQIVQDPSIPNWQQAQLATQPQRICDKCYTEMRPPTGSRSATAPPTQPRRIASHGNGHIRRSTSSQSIMSECPVCGKRLSEVSLDKDVQEEHVQTCLNVGSPSVATVRYVSYKLPEQSPLIGQECLICFEEFEPGKSSGLAV